MKNEKRNRMGVNLGIVFGTGLGIVFGCIVNQIAWGIIIGAGAGIIIGSMYDSKNKRNDDKRITKD